MRLRGPRHVGNSPSLRSLRQNSRARQDVDALADRRGGRGGDADDPAGEARPEQVGAFLMLLRVKEETGEEIAGFIRAARAALAAGRHAGGRSRLAVLRRQEAPAPWFLLAAALIARSGWSVFMLGSTATPRGASMPARRCGVSVFRSPSTSRRPPPISGASAWPICRSRASTRGSPN